MPYVYLITKESQNVYKIGFTKKNPMRRLKQLQTGNDEVLTIVKQYESSNAKQIENVWHRTLKHIKKHGEWFELDIDSVVNFVDTCKKIDNSLQFMSKHNSYYQKKFNIND